MILLIDNYDSFVFNLARYFQRLGFDTQVVRNDAIDTAGVLAFGPSALVLSPGPGTPQQAGGSLELVRRLHARLPLLGICLGHQTIAEALGGRVERAAEPMHGRSSQVFHNQQGVFAGMSSPLTACRYHSLVVEEASLPESLQVTARTAEGVVMAIAHRKFPVVGLQFHPESILTSSGYQLLVNFLKGAGLNVAREPPDFKSELVPPRQWRQPPGNTPVTF